MLVEPSYHYSDVTITTNYLANWGAGIVVNGAAVSATKLDYAIDYPTFGSGTYTVTVTATDGYGSTASGTTSTTATEDTGLKLYNQSGGSRELILDVFGYYQ